MLIRDEREADHAAVFSLNATAFPTDAEARLVDALRTRAHPTISLVAEDEEGIVVGHILFSPVTLREHPDRFLMGLAPMAVLPERQRSGIGSALVQAGLKSCATLGVGAVVVLGHPDYYPKFGFVPSVGFGVVSTYDVPPEFFMALELKHCSLDGGGTVVYHAAFNELETDEPH